MDTRSDDRGLDVSIWVAVLGGAASFCVSFVAQEVAAGAKGLHLPHFSTLTHRISLEPRPRYSGAALLWPQSWSGWPFDS